MITYKNGKKTGPMKQYWEDGHLKFECNLVNNTIEGSTKTNYVDGTIHYEGSYIHGLKDGKWTTYDEYGKVSKVELYKMDELIDDKSKDGKDNSTNKK
jgi:antitoxin component YwqK of YwqJK toxin-antitoxin module